MIMFDIYAIQCGSHQPQVAMDYLKYTSVTEELNFKFNSE